MRNLIAIFGLMTISFTAQAESTINGGMKLLQSNECFKAINESNPQIAFMAAKSLFVSFDSGKSRADREVYKVHAVQDIDGSLMLTPLYVLTFRLDSEKHLKAPCTDYVTASYSGDFFYQIK